MTILDFLGFCLMIAFGVPFCWIAMEYTVAMWSEMLSMIVGWFR